MQNVPATLNPKMSVLAACGFQNMFGTEALQPGNLRTLDLYIYIIYIELHIFLRVHLLTIITTTLYLSYNLIFIMKP